MFNPKAGLIDRDRLPDLAHQTCLGNEHNVLVY